MTASHLGSPAPTPAAKPSSAPEDDSNVWVIGAADLDDPTEGEATPATAAERAGQAADGEEWEPSLWRRCQTRWRRLLARRARPDVATAASPPDLR